MKTRRFIRTLCLTMLVLMGACQVASAAGKEPQVPLTEHGEKLLTTYTEMLNSLKAEIKAAVPKIDEQKKSAFVAAHAAVAKVPPQPNPAGLKMAPPQYAPGHKLYDEAQSKAVVAAGVILPNIDAFLASDKLDAKLAKCALIAHATSRGLAVFAQQGKEHEALIDELLGDDKLIKQAMELGGCYSRKYGQAMQSYKAILKASKRAKEGFFQSFALASSMEHPDGNIQKEGMTAAQVNVEIYLDYEKAYLAGKLDEAFDTFSDFNYRFAMHHFSVEDLNWMREMMRNYRPDHITNPDYKWRYCRIVKTDVPYTSGLTGARPIRPDLNVSRFQDFFLEGGICGPRCFTGKLATAAFGIPTRFATQTGHAAMCHWTPDGWTTVFGGHWVFNRHKGICGLDFSLEERARSAKAEYMKVNRAEWVGYAMGETVVSKRQYGVGGDFWNAMAFYKKLAIVEAARIVEVGTTGEELAESNEEAVAEEIVQIELTQADKTVVVDKNGVITIPVAACRSPKNTDKIRFMKTIDGKGLQMHYNLAGNRPELLRYSFNVPKAGEYEFTAHVVTVTVDKACLIRLNRRTLIDIPVPYTRGMWQDTKPVTIKLKEGKNRFEITYKAPNKGLTVKHFKLTPVGKLPSSKSSSTESSKKQAFTFVQVCDTQLGFGRYKHDLKTFKQAVDQINALKTDLVVICGDLVGRPDEKSLTDFNAIKAQFKVPCYCVPGNHDVGNTATLESLKKYRKDVGKDYYSFEHKGYVFVCVNTPLWKAPVAGESEKHDAWFKATLESAAKRKLPIFIIGHYPLYTKQLDEVEGYGNLPVAKRKELLLLFEKHGVVAFLTGHAHKIIINEYNGIQLVSGQATSRTHGSPLGFRLWHVTDVRPFKHESVDLEGF